MTRGRRKLDEGERFNLSEGERAFMQGNALPVEEELGTSIELPAEQIEKPKTDRLNRPTDQTAKPSRAKSKPDPWAGLEPEEREPTIRLNVDIPLSLNDKLAEKARNLRQPKTELVRRLLEWALNESSE